MNEVLKDFKVLAVDDNPKNIQVIGSILMEANYEVGFAMDGKQALELLSESKDYDLVLLDVNMPVMNGFETCKAMRHSEFLREIPVIFLTALNEPENILTGFDVGGQDYVSKPFNSKELLSRVKTHLDLKRSKDQLKMVNQWLEIKVKERTQELQKANADLEIANNELIYLDKAKGDFLEKLSHEIRAPLAGIIGFITVLQNEINPTELMDLLKYLDVSAARLERFTTISMLITELRTKTTSIKREEVKVDDLIEFIRQRQSEQIELRNMSVAVEGAIDTITINGERNLLEICFESLLDNALKYSPNGSKLTISIKSIEGQVICSFIDQGRKFNKETLAKIYDFLSLKDKQFEDNEALDIALVNLIMDAHLGKMEVTNNDKAGATICLIFPDFSGVNNN
ncbi:MAG: hybrid sensor histidine kinase/response regulator [Mariniphaga sp.]|nr:hybrid sensor histidine kinase/response regulator [Mariniphaga sp.]